jgi:hypothetical protein
MEQLTLPIVNLATHFLQSIGESIQEWDGKCSDVADEVMERHGGDLVWVDGDACDQYGWWYHAVPMIDGLIHDAWLEGWHQIPEPQTLENWLVKMFGTEHEIAVTVGGEEIYEGLPQNFQPL